MIKTFSGIALWCMGLMMSSVVLHARAADWSTPGPFLIGSRSVSSTRADNTTFTAQVYYPAVAPGANHAFAASAAPAPAISFGMVSLNPYESPRATTPIEPTADTESPSVWPILISAFLFAIAHWTHGPDWIPLFLLAIGLGYLYRQTHRVVPCIVVHFLLNATSMSLVALSLVIGEGKLP